MKCRKTASKKPWSCRKTASKKYSFCRKTAKHLDLISDGYSKSRYAKFQSGDLVFTSAF